MRHKTITIAAMASALFAFAAGALAQHEEHHAPNQTAQSQAGQSQPIQPNATHCGMMGQMMTMMGAMMTQHQQMSENMDKLMQSMGAIENEKDPAALKAKVAELRSAIEQMRSQMTQQGGMMMKMKMSSDMMGTSGGTSKTCPMMNDAAKPATN